MDRSNRQKAGIAGRVVLVIAPYFLVLNPSQAQVPLTPPFSNSNISSDFGPRNVASSFFHGGLDYARPIGTPITSIEPGAVESVKGNDKDAGGWRIRIRGTQTNRVFLYMHMFSNGAAPGTISGNFQLGQDPDTLKYFITRLSDGALFREAPPLTPPVMVGVEAIGPVGDSGSAAGVPHLHFQLGTVAENNLDNPFVFVQSPVPNYSVSFSQPPRNGYVITPTEISSFTLRFTINSTAGFNLDVVRVAINGQPLTVPSDTTLPRAAFRYGGAVGQDATASALTTAGEPGVALPAPLGGNATFRVNPIMNGADEFIIENVDLSGLRDGEHTITVEPLSISGVVSPPGGARLNFWVARTPPRLTLINADGERMDHGSVSQNAVVTLSATRNPAPVRSIELFTDSILIKTIPVPPGKDMTFPMTFAANAWYYARACDGALNCVYNLFGIFAPGTTPPPPPGPPAPLPGSTQRPNPVPGQPLPPPDTPGNPPSPPAPFPAVPGPGTPPCRGIICQYKPPAPNPVWISLLAEICDRTPQICNVPVQFPHDPNAKYGPSGSVVPGQLMTYTIEFENVGEGLALETYVRDALDPALDETTLVLRNMQGVNYLTKAEWPANFPWSYDPRTRMITVLTGDAGAREGGRFLLEARLRPDTQPGTIISNQAIVHFPTVFEVTPTNVIVSAVPLPTRLAYEGASSATYLAPAHLAARLTAAGRPLIDQPVEFLLAGATFTATTDAFGLVTVSTASIAVLPGAYNMQIRYPGDNFLYSPQTTTLDFTIHKKPVRLDTPFAAARANEPARLTLRLVDDDGQILERQDTDPKTVFLDIIDEGGAVTPLTSSLLSGATASFEITLPRPLQLVWSMRARFDGDLRYAAAISTGVLRLIDETPPTITILSPSAGQTYAGAQLIPISFTVRDSEDPSPSSFAVLRSTMGATVPVANSQAVVASTLSPGDWSLVVWATDWAGNEAQAQSGLFRVVADAMPPRTSLTIGQPSSGTIVSGRTPFVLASIDDMLTVGDGQGLGVAFQELHVDGVLRSTFTNPAPAISQVFTSTFTLAGYADSTRVLGFLAQDIVGNQEAIKISTVILDATPPVALLLSPSSLASGMDQVFGHGRIPIYATIADTHLRDFTLDFAPGMDAPAGFTTLTTGTAAISASIIARWDTTQLSGFYTLRLTASDLVENITITTATVYIGDPKLLLAIENTPQHRLLDEPEGVTVDKQGHIFVANTGKDEILKFDAQGRLIAALGRDAGFDGPTGIALDTQDNIYVADRDNHRIVVLSPTGTVLKSIGKTGEDGGEPGIKPGEFNEPAGVAVSTSLIVVADSDNERIQVFSPDFNFLREIKLPSPPGGWRKPDDESEDDIESEPFGVALDTDNNIYVTDEENDRILAFNTNGGLLFIFGKEGKAPGEFDDPHGIAVSPLKYIYVADEDNRRVQKIDPFRNPVLAFGAAFGPQSPIGTALDSAGSLYITDEKTHRVLKFGPPTMGSTATVAATPPVIGPTPSPGSQQSGGIRTMAMGPDPAFRLGEVYVFPNPALRDAAPTFHIECGIADAVKISVYTASGRNAHEQTIMSMPEIIGDRYAYEYIWRGHIPSGVYYYVIEATKAGQKLKKTGKFAVVR